MGTARVLMHKTCNKAALAIQSTVGSLGEPRMPDRAGTGSKASIETGIYG